MYHDAQQDATQPSYDTWRTTVYHRVNRLTAKRVVGSHYKKKNDLRQSRRPASIDVMMRTLWIILLLLIKDAVSRQGERSKCDCEHGDCADLTLGSECSPVTCGSCRNTTFNKTAVVSCAQDCRNADFYNTSRVDCLRPYACQDITSTYCDYMLCRGEQACSIKAVIKTGRVDCTSETYSPTCHQASFSHAELYCMTKQSYQQVEVSSSAAVCYTDKSCSFATFDHSCVILLRQLKRACSTITICC